MNTVGRAFQLSFPCIGRELLVTTVPLCVCFMYALSRRMEHHDIFSSNYRTFKEQRVSQLENIFGFRHYQICLRLWKSMAVLGTVSIKKQDEEVLEMYC